MVMDSEDKRYLKAVEKEIKRKEEEEARKKKECKRQCTEQKMLSISNNGDSSVESDVGEIDKIFVVSEKKEKYSKTVTVVLPRDILSSDKVAQMTDTVGLSHNKLLGL